METTQSCCNIAVHGLIFGGFIEFVVILSFQLLETTSREGASGLTGFPNCSYPFNCSSDGGFMALSDLEPTSRSRSSGLWATVMIRSVG